VRAELENRPDGGELSRFIGSSPQATFFHTPAWMDSIGRALPRFRPAWLTVRRGGALAGVMPVVRVLRGPFHLLLCLPFGSYGDPLALDAEAKGALIDGFLEMARSPRCAEAVATLFFGGIESPPTGVRMIMEECRLVSLDGGFEEAWGRASAKRRQLCRRGEAAGVLVRPLETEAELRLFHDIYRTESTAWGGVHPYPFALFLELFRRRESVIVWGAFLGDVLLGAHIDLYHGNMAQAWQGGMTERARDYDAGALLIKGAMAEACRRGMRFFNLGSSGGNEGIMFFKESFGGREHRYAVWTTAKRWWMIARRR
jgi:CelD/BcsL family acetyltransferase involved in cellulose biosynthesis